MQDIAEILAKYDRGADEDVDDPPGSNDDAVLESINMIMIRGNRYRLDNIMFSTPSHSITGNNAVNLFPIGHVYCPLYGAQGNKPQGRWIYAEDLDLGLTCESTDDGGLFFPRIAGDADGDGVPTPFRSTPTAPYKIMRILLNPPLPFMI